MGLARGKVREGPPTPRAAAQFSRAFLLWFASLLLALSLALAGRLAAQSPEPARGAKAGPEGSAPLLLLTAPERTKLSGPLQYLPDPEGRIGLARAIDAARRGDFHPAEAGELQPGLVYWTRLRIRNTSAEPDWALCLGRDREPARAEVWVGPPFPVQTADSQELPAEPGLIARSYRVTRAGFLAEYENRALAYPPRPCVRLRAPADTERSVYLRVGCPGCTAPRLAIQALPAHTRLRELNQTYFAQGAFQGGVWLMLLFNLILFLLLKDAAHLFYSLYAAAISGVFLVYHGLLDRYLDLQAAHAIYLLAGGLIPAFYARFAQLYLGMHRLMPRWNRILHGVIAAQLIQLVIVLVYFFWNGYTAGLTYYNLGLQLAYAAFTVVFLVAVYRSRSVFARLFILGSAMLPLTIVIGVVMAQLCAIGGAAESFQIGGALELALLAVSLGYRARKRDQQRERAREGLIQALRRRRHAERRMTQQLEQQVDARTRELRESNEELQNLTAQRDRMYSIIAHDLRTSLGGVMQFVEVLREEDDAEQQRELLGHLGVQAVAGFELLENLLYWTRSQSADFSIRAESLAPREAALRVADQLDIPCEQKGVVLVLEVPAELRVSVDRVVLELVLRNLANNALKFSRSGGRIRIIARATDARFAEFSVVDEGVGMAPEQLQRIRSGEGLLSSRGTHGEGGSGLGLRLVREFLQRSGSQLNVESELDRGSRFWFILPLA